MEVGLVKRVDIDQEMQQAYLDYAMSVIVARALPDARDGLKPVQRRILYAMQDLSLSYDSTYKKSARIVGEVLGKYHPHGDVAVYEAMARLAQDFSMRYPLVDGQGNFGSIDGDPPAAMRYTEARLTRFATELMAQIERNTVDFGDNFDGTLTEPLVLPAAVPNLLVNGASGIAVGMATSIPPHNLSEVIDALLFMLARWENLDDLAVPDLMRFIKGPDFPTGGIILQESGENAMEAAYGSGRGRVIVRGRVHAEDLGRGRTRLIITELPYQVNKTNLIERIAELARGGDLEGIADLRDESDRQGMRIVIELKQGAEADGTLRSLYKSTPLQNTFGINILALVDNEPRLLNLKQALRVFIEHRLTVVRRRSEFDLARARHRAHILEGLRVALKNLNEIISLIRSAPDVEQARLRLMKRFNLSEIQAQAILDMQLRRLASLERKKIEEEYKEVTALIKVLEGLLVSAKRMREVVGEELLAMKQAYGDRRRTQIVSLEEGEKRTQFLTASDLAPTQVVWIGVTPDGRIARSHTDTLPDLSGEGIVRHLLQASTRHTLYLLAESGFASAVAVSSLGEAETFAGGTPLYKSSAFAPEDRLASMFAVNPEDIGADNLFALAVTRQGMIKKSAFTELPGPSAQKFPLIKVTPGDTALTVMVTDGKGEVGIFTDLGMGIRFSEEDVRPMGLVAAGVMGVKLADADAVVAALKWDDKAELLFLTSDGSALRVLAADFPQQGRYGQGVIACRTNPGTKIVSVVMGLKNISALVIYHKAEPKRVRIADVVIGKRAQKPVSALPLKSSDGIVGVIRLGDVEIAKKRKDPESGSAGGQTNGSRQAKPTSKKTTAVKPASAGSVKKLASAVVGNSSPTKKAPPKSPLPAAGKEIISGGVNPTATKKTAAKSLIVEEVQKAVPPVEKDSGVKKTATGTKIKGVSPSSKTKVVVSAADHSLSESSGRNKAAASKPAATKPEASKSLAFQPVPTKPGTVKSSASKSEGAKASKNQATPVDQAKSKKAKSAASATASAANATVSATDQSAKKTPKAIPTTPSAKPSSGPTGATKKPAKGSQAVLPGIED